MNHVTSARRRRKGGGTSLNGGRGTLPGWAVTIDDDDDEHPTTTADSENNFQSWETDPDVVSTLKVYFQSTSSLHRYDVFPNDPIRRCWPFGQVGRQGERSRADALL